MFLLLIKADNDWVSWSLFLHKQFFNVHVASMATLLNIILLEAQRYPHLVTY